MSVPIQAAVTWILPGLRDPGFFRTTICTSAPNAVRKFIRRFIGYRFLVRNQSVFISVTCPGLPWISGELLAVARYAMCVFGCGSAPRRRYTAVLASTGLQMAQYLLACKGLEAS